MGLIRTFIKGFVIAKVLQFIRGRASGSGTSRR